MSQANPRGRNPSVTPVAEPGASAPADQPPLTPDEIFHLLQTNRRRDALRYLKRHEGPVRMRDLAEQVAAWENDTTVRALSSRQRQRVYIPLYQTHLPKLDEAGVIEYDQSRGVVERTPVADQLDPYLEGVTKVDDEPAAADESADVAAVAESRDWTGYYTGASGLGILLVGGSMFQLPVLSTLSGPLVGIVVSAMFGLLTLARIVDDSLEPVTA